METIPLPNVPLCHSINLNKSIQSSRFYANVWQFATRGVTINKVFKYSKTRTSGDVPVRHDLDRLTLLIKANRCTKLIIKVQSHYTAAIKTVWWSYDSSVATSLGQG